MLIFVCICFHIFRYSLDVSLSTSVVTRHAKISCVESSPSKIRRGRTLCLWALLSNGSFQCEACLKISRASGCTSWAVFCRTRHFLAAMTAMRSSRVLELDLRNLGYLGPVTHILMTWLVAFVGMSPVD